MNAQQQFSVRARLHHARVLLALVERVHVHLAHGNVVLVLQEEK